MLLQTQRLSRAEFAVLLAHGKRYFTPTLSAVWMRGPSLSQGGKVGVVVSKKVARLSVARHRLRRQVYSAVRPHLPHLHGVHIAFILKKQGEGDGFATLARDVASAVRAIPGAYEAPTAEVRSGRA